MSTEWMIDLTARILSPYGTNDVFGWRVSTPAVNVVGHGPQGPSPLCAERPVAHRGGRRRHRRHPMKVLQLTAWKQAAKLVEARAVIVPLEP